MEILTALGLAAPAGLNAPLVLLLVGLAGRFTGLVDLPADYDWIESWEVLGGLTAWLALEEVLDKIPGADHVNDAVNTALRPAAGAVVSPATTQGDVAPVVAGALGVLLAGTTHAAKAGARPVVTVGTAGMGNPFVSVAEDAIAVVSVAVALIAPVLVVLVLAALGWGIVTIVRRRRRRERRRS
jgi:hypothetical protein